MGHAVYTVLYRTKVYLWIKFYPWAVRFLDICRPLFFFLTENASYGLCGGRLKETLTGKSLLYAL